MFQTAQPRRLHGSWERRKPRPVYIHLTGSQEGSGDCSSLPPTGYLWVAQLQEATEHAGKLEPHSEKPLPAAGKEASCREGGKLQVSGKPSSRHHACQHTTLSYTPSLQMMEGIRSPQPIIWPLQLPGPLTLASALLSWQPVPCSHLPKMSISS